ncbi:MAG: hypothetical protein AAGF47_02565 [Planctomycetota bacterium]
MPADPSRFEHSASQSTVADDRACNSCGYNLRGLLTGTPCPECGATIAIKRYAARGDNLTDAPARYLRTYAMWAALTAAGGVATVVVTMGGWLVGGGPFVFVGIGASLVFAGGAAMLTRPRPRGENTIPDATIDDPRWRIAAMASPAAWLLMATSVALLGIATANLWRIADALAFLTWPAFMLALVASIPLHIHLASVAGWAGDTGLASRLRSVAWVFGIGTLTVLAAALFAAIVPDGLAAAIRIAAIGLYAIVGLAMLVGLLGFVQFAAVTAAAVRTNRAQHDRDRRIAERRAAEMSETVDRQFNAPGPPDPVAPIVPAAPPIPESDPPPRIGQGQRIEPAETQNAYDLEPEDPQ